MKRIENVFVTSDTAFLLGSILLSRKQMPHEVGLSIPDITLQIELQSWLRRYWNLDIVPVRVASALDQLREWSLYLNGREYYHDGMKVVCADYETCLEIGLELMLKRIIDEKLNPIT